MRIVRVPWAARLVLLACAAAGCGTRHYAEVEGTLTLNGAPLGDVEIVFVPEPARGNGGNNASALTDAEGRYRLRTPKDNREAAAVGAYRVIVTDLLMVTDFTAAGLPAAAGEKAAAPQGPGGKKRRFPVAYGDVTDTPLKDVEVKPGRQTLDFDLKAGGR